MYYSFLYQGIFGLAVLNFLIFWTDLFFFQGSGPSASSRPETGGEPQNKTSSYSSEPKVDVTSSFLSLEFPIKIAVQNFFRASPFRRAPGQSQGESPKILISSPSFPRFKKAVISDFNYQENRIEKGSFEILEFFTSTLLWIFLTLLLVFRYIKSNHFPLANFYEALIFLTWCLSTLNLFLGVFSFGGFLPSEENSDKNGKVASELFFYEKQPTMQSAFSFFPPFRWKSLDLLSKPALALCVKKKIYGGILAPCILFIIAFAQFNLSSEWSPLVPALKSNWLLMHVSIMIFSYTIFIVGGLISLILLVRALPFKRATWQRLRASPKMIVSKTFSRPRGA